MRRLARLVAVLAIPAAIAASAGSEEPKGSAFIDTVNGDEFAFPSTKGWHVKGPGKEKVVLVAREPEPRASGPLERQGISYLWAGKCTPEKQKVHFVRDVFLAGPEDKLGASIGMLHAPDGRLKSARLLVNGRRVLQVGPGGGGFDRTDDRAKVFRFGENHLEVIAVKRADERKCNRSSAVGKVTGVEFNVYGELAGDVALPPQQTVEYRRLDEGAFGVAIPLDFQLRNNGPGGLARVPLYISIDVPVTGEPHGTVLQVSDPQPPVQSCKATPADAPNGFSESHPRTVLCTIANLRSGATAGQHARISFFVPSGSGKTPVHIRWSAFVDEPKGANGTDNERYKTIWLCKSDDPDPACPGDPSS